jgi:hypothetical protein
MVRQRKKEGPKIFISQWLQPIGTIPVFPGWAALAAGKINNHSIGVRANSLRPQA